MSLKIKQKQVEQPKESLFTRGYGAVTAKMEKASKFTMSCFNCDYYYQAVGDSNEVCQNPDVLKYDMVVTENNIYCNRWQLCRKTETAKGLFKKGSRV